MLSQQDWESRLVYAVHLQVVIIRVVQTCFSFSVGRLVMLLSYSMHYNPFGHELFSLVHFSPLTDWVTGGT